MVCLITIVVGVAAITNMPVDLFPPVKIPVVVVATFYSGMPPEQIESDITDSDERFFTLGSNITRAAFCPKSSWRRIEARRNTRADSRPFVSIPESRCRSFRFNSKCTRW